MPLKTVLGLLAVIMALSAFWPYIRETRAGRCQPHVFSWLIWASTTWVVFFAQCFNDAAAGAWPTAISALLASYIAWLAWCQRRALPSTVSDRVFLYLALSALPFWWLTEEALAAVVIMTLIDMLAFAPTLRQAYQQPFAEVVSFYFMIVIRNVLAIAALADYSWTTALFPAAIGSASLLMVALLLWRRRQYLTASVKGVQSTDR